ncbi:MAG: ATP-binding protein [Bacillota bacterium]|jgi:anti-sigma regulatory factor (Ser/Thr protein kinase)|nr:ATP-binding protein [Bacillota bacterium]
MAEELVLEFEVGGLDFAAVGEASGGVKRALQQVGMGASVVRRAAVCAFEVETNIVIHATRGVVRARISPERVVVEAEDEGPGIRDLELAMREGYSTAPAYIREMGFGAGMGFANMRRCSDSMEVSSEVGKGTRVRLVIEVGKP